MKSQHLLLLPVLLLCISTLPGFSGGPTDEEQTAIEALSKIGGDVSSTKVALVTIRKWPMKTWCT